LNFNIPLRRKFPISTISYLHKGFTTYNARRSYDQQIKPFAFLQAAPVAIVMGKDVLPVAPMEFDLAKARRLPWTDFNTGEPVNLDWDGSYHAGTVPVMKLSEYIEKYKRHPESKTADPNGGFAGEETRGLLGRLHFRSWRPAHIGKEIDRLDEDQDRRWATTAQLFTTRQQTEFSPAQSVSCGFSNENKPRMKSSSPNEPYKIFFSGRVRRIHRKTRLAIIRVARKYQHSVECVLNRASR